MRKKTMMNSNLLRRFARIGLVLVLTMLASAVLSGGWYGPTKAEAAVAVLDAWPTTPQLTATTGDPSGTFSISTGTNRLLVVAVGIVDSANTAWTISATYGGVALTQSAAPQAQRRTAWIGYLKEADIAGRSGDTLTVTITGVHTDARVYIASYTGVDQTTPATGVTSYVNNVATGALGSLTAGTNGAGYRAYIWSGTTAVTRTSDTETFTEHSDLTNQGTILTLGAASKAINAGAASNPTVTWSAAGRIATASIMINAAVACTDTDVATLTTTNPAASATVSGTVTIQTQVGTETPGSGMTGMVVNIAGSTGCNVTNGTMTWNAGTSRWEYSWDTSVCGTGTPDTGVTIDVSGYDPDCGGTTLVNASQIANVTIDNTCSDGDPVSSVTVTPASSATVSSTVTVQAAIAGEGAPGTGSAAVTITGSDFCNVTAQAMTWNSGNSRWEYSWNTTSCGLAAPDTGVSVSINYTDPDCPDVTNGTSTNISINNMDPSKIASCAGCHDYPPADGARSGATGAILGSHQPHNKQPAYVCSICHVAPAGETSAYFGHRDGTITMQSSIQGGAYAGGTHAQNNAPSLTNCSTNNCHGGAAGNTPTPVWGGTSPGCITCHNGVVVALNASAASGGAVTQRDAVKGEFNLAWGHRNTARTTANGAVTDADCIVCHLEGNYTTQKTSSYHADGYIDLRDPDVQGETRITDYTGAPFRFTKFSISYAAGSRTTAISTNSADPQYIADTLTQKFCIPCHDSDGALNTTARSNNGGTGTAAMPFGGIALGANYTATNGAIGTQGLIDVKTQFATTNSSIHPVLGPRNSDFPSSSRLADPYKTTGRDASDTDHVLANSVVMNCFDCHNTVGRLTNRTVAAHGNAVTIMAPVYTNANTTNTTMLCTICHAGYNAASGGTPDLSRQHPAGSALNVEVRGSTNTVCHGCHASATTKPSRPVPAQDYHGFNSLVGGTYWTGSVAVGKKAYAFIRNTSNFIAHRPYRSGEWTTGSATCQGDGTRCAGNNGTQTYTPGGTY